MKHAADAVDATATRQPHPRLLPASGTVLGFDFGARRIGLAVGELGFRQASPLGTVVAEDRARRFDAIARHIAEWQPVGLVVGVPRAADGGAQAMTARCLRFARQLEGRFGLPVDTIDERLSSWEAERQLKHRGVDTRRREAIDAEAARLILQSYFDELARP